MHTVCWNLWQITKIYSVISKFDTVMSYKAQPVHMACQMQDWLRANCTDFIAKNEWPPNSPDFNQLDYHLWGAMLQTFHKLQSKIETIPELKSALQQIWDDLPRTAINKAINGFCKRLNACASASGGHFQQMIWTLYRNILTELCFRNCNKVCVLTHCLSSNSKVHARCIVKNEN